MSSVLKDKKRSIGFKYAWNGIRLALKNERNFRLHLLSALLVIICSFIFQLSAMEWGIILLIISLVITLEMVNSVIERLIDYVKPEIHPQAKMIKDIAAGAVLISAIFSVVIGLIIFIPKIIDFL